MAKRPAYRESASRITGPMVDKKNKAEAGGPTLKAKAQKRGPLK